LVASANLLPFIVLEVVEDLMRNCDGKMNGQDRKNKRRFGLPFYKALID
jgi:hypothetical protein